MSGISPVISAAIKIQARVRVHQLLEAAGNGDSFKVKLLLARGADVNATDKYGRTALHKAAAKGYKDIANLLINKKARLEATGKYGRTALHEAVKSGHVEIVKLLLAKGADVNVTNEYGNTALHRAAAKGYKDIANLLLAKGADVDATDNDGWTALHWAANIGFADIVKALVIAGADVNVTNNDGWTALDWAIANGDTKIVEALVIEGKTHVFNELKLLANKQEIVEEAYSVKNKIFTFLQLKNYLIKEYDIQDNEAVTQDQINVMYTLYQFPKMIESFGNCFISWKEWHELENPVICKGNHFEKEDLDRWKNHKSLHPVTNKKNEKIVYFEDAAMKKMIELHKKISITKIQAMARGNLVR